MTEKKNPHGVAATGAGSTSNNNTSQQQPANANVPRESLNSLLRDTTRDYIASLDPDDWPDAEMFERGLMAEVLSAVLARNATAPKDDKWKVPKEMEPPMVAMALMARQHYVRLDFSDGEELETDAMPLHFYNHATGLYEECELDVLGKQVRGYKFTASPNFIDNVHAVLREEAPIRTRTRDANLDVVRNGIRNRRTGELMPFTHEMVFTTKTAVDWVDDPPMPTCTSDDGWEWNIEDALLEMAGGDAEVAEFLWDVVMASARPNVRWDVAFFPYSTTGNNGKGTLCQLIRNILGKGTYTSIPFANFNNNHFMLNGLQRAQAVITDENQVGQYADDNAEFKAAVTNDVFRIDRKHKPPISSRFYGTIIECVNEIPKVRDRSDSFWRRVVPVPFPACFTGRERPEVKHDFIARQDVLEYVQWRALTKDCNKLVIPQKCLDLKEEFKAESSTVFDFFNDVYPRFQWQAVPAQLVYDMYLNWYEEQEHGGGNPARRHRFYSEISPLFEAKGCNAYHKDTKFTSVRYMRGPEPMILEFNCGKWMASYRGPDEDRRATPEKLCYSYSGWLFPEQRPNGAGGGVDA